MSRHDGKDDDDICHKLLSVSLGNSKENPPPEVFWNKFRN